MEQPQALGCVQLLPSRAQGGQAAGYLPRHPVKEGPGLPHVLPVGGEGEIALLDHAVGCVSDLSGEHVVVLLPVTVQAVPLGGQEDGALEVLPVHPLVVDGDLGDGPGVQGVEQLRPPQEHGRLVLLGGDGVVDVGKADGLGIGAAKTKDPIRPDAADGDGVLDGAGYFVPLPVPLQNSLQGLTQPSTPPSGWSAPCTLRTGFPICRPAFWDREIPSGHRPG